MDIALIACLEGGAAQAEPKGVLPLGQTEWQNPPSGVTVAV